MLSVVLFLSTQVHASNELIKIRERGSIRVGTLYGQTSYYLGPSGPVGFEYELANAFAKFLGVKLEVVPSYHISELFPMLENGQVDILAGGFTITPERRNKFRFSPSYTLVSQKLVFKQGNKRPRKVSDLKGVLVVTSGSSHAETLNLMAKNNPDLTWAESAERDADELLQAVLDGEIDYTITDSNTLAINRRYYPDLSIGFTVANEMPNSWLLKKSDDDSLYALTIEFFGNWHKSGKLLALEDKYFGHVRKFNYVDTRLFIKAAKEVLPKYKALFQKYADDVDWRLLAAQSYQESLWDPKARSHTGVRGIMMLTLPTAKQMGIKSRLNAEQSIKGGAKYLNNLIKRIPDRIKQPDRLWFAIAAYNIGWGHIEDARIITQRHGGDPDKWIDVKKRLPLLRQKKYYKKTKYGYARGNEPVTYVSNIRRYYDTLVWLDEQHKDQQKKNELKSDLAEKSDE